MFSKLIQSNDIILERLAFHHIEHYLRAYSTQVQSLLHVNSSISEREYIFQKIKEKSFLYGVFLENINNLIGAIEIRDPCYRSQLYCWLNENYWGKNYFAQAMQQAVRLYFEQTDEKTISARVDCKNKRSYYALIKFGFKEIKIVPGGYGPQYELILEK